MRDTFELLIGLLIDIETDHMRDKIDPLLLQLFGCTTWIRIAGLFTVRDKNDRRFLFSILEFFGCFFQ